MDPVLAVPGYALLLLAGAAVLPGLFTPRAGVGRPVFQLVVVLIAAFFTWRSGESPDQAVGRFNQMIILAALLTWLVTSRVVLNRRARWILLGTVSAGCLLQAGVAILQVYFKEPALGIYWPSRELESVYLAKFGSRARGFYLNPNHFAWLINGAAILCASVAIWGRVPIAGRVLVGYFAVVLTGVEVFAASRGGIASLVCGGIALIGLGVIGGFRLRRGGTGMAISGAAMGLVLIGAVWLAYSSSWLAIGRFGSEVLSANVRQEFSGHAWRAFQTEPAWGIGAGMYRYAARLYRSPNEPLDAVYAHNDWLQVAAEYGSIGLLLALVVVGLALGFAGKTFVRELKRRSVAGDTLRSNSMALSIGAFAAGVSFAVHSTVDFNLQIPANAVFAAFIFGLAGGGGRDPSAQPLRSSIFERCVAGACVLCCAIVLGFTLWPGAAVDYHVLMARNAILSARCDLALAETSKALRLDPDDVGALTVRGEALYAYESAQGMIGALDNGGLPELVIDENPHKLAIGATGDLLAGRNKYFAAAAASFERAALQLPMERELWVSMAKALSEVDGTDPTESERLLRIAIRLDPGHPYAYGCMGDHFQDLDDYTKAIEYYSLGAIFPGGSYAESMGVDLRIELGLMSEEEAGDY